MQRILICDLDNVAHSYSFQIAAALRRIARWVTDNPDPTHAIHVTPATSEGYLEWTLVLDASDQGGYVQGQSFLLGLVQRREGAEIEFHS